MLGRQEAHQLEISEYFCLLLDATDIDGKDLIQMYCNGLLRIA